MHRLFSIILFGFILLSTYAFRHDLVVIKYDTATINEQVEKGALKKSVGDKMAENLGIDKNEKLEYITPAGNKGTFWDTFWYSSLIFGLFLFIIFVIMSGGDDVAGGGDIAVIFMVAIFGIISIMIVSKVMTANQSKLIDKVVYMETGKPYKGAIKPGNNRYLELANKADFFYVTKGRFESYKKIENEPFNQAVRNVYSKYKVLSGVDITFDVTRDVLRDLHDELQTKEKDFFIEDWNGKKIAGIDKLSDFEKVAKKIKKEYQTLKKQYDKDLEEAAKLEAKKAKEMEKNEKKEAAKKAGKNVLKSIKKGLDKLSDALED